MKRSHPCYPGTNPWTKALCSRSAQLDSLGEAASIACMGIDSFHYSATVQIHSLVNRQDPVEFFGCFQGTMSLEFMHVVSMWL